MVKTFGSSTLFVHATSLTESPWASRDVAQAAAHEGDEALPALLAGPPQLVVADLLDPLPVDGAWRRPTRAAT